MTLVGFGTSSSELVTSIQAALSGAPGIAVGNVVGSNIANILLIIGLAALFAPIAVSRDALTRDGAAMVAATLVGLRVLAMGAVGRLAGLAFVALLADYDAAVFSLERRNPTPAADVFEAEAAIFPTPRTGLVAAPLITAAGFAITILGILGATVLVHPLVVPSEIICVDGWLMLSAALVLMVFAYNERRLDRREGLVLLSANGGYLAGLAVSTT